MLLDEDGDVVTVPVVGVVVFVGDATELRVTAFRYPRTKEQSIRTVFI